MGEDADAESSVESSTEHEYETGTSFGAWTLVWTLVVMKVVTIAVVTLAARRAEAGILFALITWHWLVVLAALLAAPLLFRYRLRRVRARRERLLRAEWMLDEVKVGVRTLPRGSAHDK